MSRNINVNSNLERLLNFMTAKNEKVQQIPLIIGLKTCNIRA